MLVGRPGIAKSSGIRSLAEQYGMHSITVSPALAGEAAFGAVPVPGKDGVLDSPPPYWYRDLKEGGKHHGQATLLLIDEVTSAAEHLLPPLLSVLVEGVVGGGHRLPGSVRAVAACNPERMAVNAARLAPNVTVRFGWIDADIQKSEQSSFAESYGSYLTTTASGANTRVQPYQEVERDVLAAWGSRFARVTGIAKAFFKARPGLVECYPAGASEAKRNWPNPRSWEWALRAAASSRIHGISCTEELRFVGSFVGEGAANEFLNFMSSNDIQDPDQVLWGGEEVAWSSRIDSVYGTVGACVSRLAGYSNTQQDSKEWAQATEGANNLLAYLSRAPGKYADLATQTLADVTRLPFPYDYALQGLVSNLGRKVLQAAPQVNTVLALPDAKKGKPSKGGAN
jgi:hypothetical protein